MFRQSVSLAAAMLGLIGGGLGGSFAPADRYVSLGALRAHEQGTSFRKGKVRGRPHRQTGVAAARRAAKQRRKARAIASKRRGAR